VTHQVAVLSGPLGLLVVTINVLLDQIGIPLPAIPALVIAGAVASGNSMAEGELFLGAVAACLAADTSWYMAGRVYGNGVMRVLCRISLTPDSCVSQTHSRFERWGSKALLVAKFVPGLSIIAPPLAGATRMGWMRFLSFSSLGAALWVGSGLGAGVLLKTQIETLLPHLKSAGTIAGILFAATLAAYIGFKWWQRRRFYGVLRMARISAAELYELIDAGAAPLIVDVRTATAWALEPQWIPGAIHLPIHDLDKHVKELPRDREIILYCTCPNEVSAAQVAKLLMNSGFKRVRPLHGGLEAWISAGYAMDTAAIATSGGAARIA
jgi:membrane protein DedA with SNARE-associated domain/rhodanese-related sulfurtransferase